MLALSAFSVIASLLFVFAISSRSKQVVAVPVQRVSDQDRLHRSETLATKRYKDFRDTHP